MINKPEYNSPRWNAIKRIQSYLSNRKQYVQRKNQIIQKAIASGVPNAHFSFCYL